MLFVFVLTRSWYRAGSGSKVQGISIEHAEQLYLSCADQKLDHSVLLVCYAPWCSYCKDIEAEVR